jgi:hypothetical protein
MAEWEHAVRERRKVQRRRNALLDLLAPAHSASSSEPANHRETKRRQRPASTSKRTSTGSAELRDSMSIHVVKKAGMVAHRRRQRRTRNRPDSIRGMVNMDSLLSGIELAVAMKSHGLAQSGSSFSTWLTLVLTGDAA